MKKIAMFLLLLFVFVVNIFASKNERKSSIDDKEKTYKSFLIKNIKPGVSYKIKKNVLKKLLSGYWIYNNNDTVYFQKNGAFSTYKWKKTGLDEILQYSGKIKIVKDNIITFKINGSKKWQDCRIKEIHFYDDNDLNSIYIELILEKISFKFGSRNELFLAGAIETRFLYKRSKKKTNHYYKGIE